MLHQVYKELFRKRSLDLFERGWIWHHLCLSCTCYLQLVQAQYVHSLAQTFIRTGSFHKVLHNVFQKGTSMWCSPTAET